MNLIALMHVTKSGKNLFEDVHDYILVELARNCLQHCAQIASVHPLHYQEKLVNAFLIPLIRLIDTDDVLVPLRCHVLQSDLSQSVFKICVVTRCDLLHRKMLLGLQMLNKINSSKPALSELVHNSEVFIRVSAFDLVTYTAHPLIKRRLIEHSVETSRGAEIDSHQEFKRRFFDFSVINFHLSYEPLPFLRKSNKSKFRLFAELNLVLFL